VHERGKAHGHKEHCELHFGGKIADDFVALQKIELETKLCRLFFFSS